MWRRRLAVLIVLATLGVLAPPASPASAGFTNAELDALAVQVNTLVNQSFNPDLTIPVATKIEPNWSYADAGAYTERFKAGCRISFPPTTLADDEYTRELMIHEMTHCYEFQLAPADPKMPKWAYEGAAEWVQSALVRKLLGSGYVSGNLESDWKDYFKSFKAPITSHKYSAMGYFAHMAFLYGDAAVFAKITAMFKATGKQAYGIFTGGDSEEFLDTIASSGTRLKPLGKSWTTDGPMIPGADKARYSPPSVSVGAGNVTISAEPFGRAVVGLNPVKQAEVIKVMVQTPGAARGLVHHETGDDPLSSEDGFYCVRGKCKCPDGRTVQQLGDDGYLSLFGHKKAAKVTVARSSIEEACDQAPSAMTVSGAFSMTVKERGSCGLRSNQMGKAPLDALFTTGFTKKRPRGLGGVHLQVSGKGTGTYTAAMNVGPPKSGTAGVTKFEGGGSEGGSWSAYNPIGIKPEIQKFGTITVNALSADGANGTVDMLLVGEAPGQSTKVRLRGRWSCEPFDKILGDAK